MSELAGRERDITAALDVYAAAKDGSASRVLLIEGPGGSGKTTVLQALEQIVSREATVFRAGARRLDRVQPRSLIERLALPSALDELLRERPVMLAIDDAQHADEASLDELARLLTTFAGRALLVVFALEGDAANTLPFPSNTRVWLRELEPESARRIVRVHYSAAPQGVIDAIVESAAGNAYELVVLAKAAASRRAAGAEEIDYSARSAIAKQLAALAPQQRSFLQLLSLMGDPVERELLDLAWPDSSELNGLLDALTPAYLRRDREHVFFDHALTASAISETIAMKIPLHRRIVAAYERRGANDLRERMALAEQMRASGDRAGAQATLLATALEAGVRGLRRAVLWASERHLELGEPPEEQFIAFYQSFFAALMETGQSVRAEAIAAHALSEGQHRKLSGLGALAAQLVQAQWTVDRRDAARASFARYAQAFDDPRDLELLRASEPPSRDG